MCYYRLYIFLGCGHSTAPANPVRLCEKARSEGQEKRARTKREQERRENAVGLGTTFADVGWGEECESGVHAEKESIPSDTTLGSSSTATTVVNSPNADEHSDGSEQEDDSFLSTGCGTLKTHPYHTLHIHTPCGPCQRSRTRLLAQVQGAHPTVRFDNWRWKAKYMGPAPDEGQYADWRGSGLGGSVGAAAENVSAMMGSWVKEWRERGGGVLGKLRESGMGKTEGRGEKYKERTGSVGFTSGLPSS